MDVKDLVVAALFWCVSASAGKGLLSFSATLAPFINNTKQTSKGRRNASSKFLHELSVIIMLLVYWLHFSNALATLHALF